MSLPRSKVLSVTRGVVANAKLAYGSPKQSQNITVNIAPNGATEVKSENEEQNIQPGFVHYGENPYSNLELPSSVEEYQNILFQKDCEMKALNLIIEIIKSNPLIINKFIIANSETLLELIKL
jgi:hypothetical protein